MSQRTERVQKLARQVLGELIHDLKDPRVGFVTVTSVRISKDLRHARVFVSVMGTEEEQKDSMAALESAKPFLRRELGRQVRMKYLPELTFDLDTKVTEAERVEQLLHQIHANDPAPAPESEGEES